MESTTSRSQVLTDAELKQLAGSAQLVTYPPQSELVREGERTDFVLYLVSGHVKVVTGEPPAIVRICGPGSIVGEGAATTGLPRTAALVTVNHVEAFLSTGAAWRAFIKDNAELLGRLYKETLTRLAHRDPQRPDSVPRSEFKVATELLRLLDIGLGATHSGDYRITGVTQRDLGLLTNLSRESVAGALRSMRAQGSVATSRSTITIRDLSALEEIAQRSYHTSEPL
jgi:CRP/FNR family transcriptional regulator, cyclic AMP receptor protein